MKNRGAESSQDGLEDVQIPYQIAVYVSNLNCNKFSLSNSLLKSCLISFTFLGYTVMNCAEFKFVCNVFTCCHGYIIPLLKINSSFL